MKAAALFQAVLGLALLAAVPVVGRGMASLLAIMQVAGSVGLLAAALRSLRAPPDREADLWGRVSIAMAVWTYIVCFAAAVTRRFPLFGVDLAVGVLSSGLASWVALRPPQPAAAPRPSSTSRIEGAKNS